MMRASRFHCLIGAKNNRHCSSVSERPCTWLFVEPCCLSQRYRVTAASPVCSTEHTCGATLQTDHIRPSSIFCCGSHSMEQSSCRIQRSDNQRCLLPMAFKDSSVRRTALAPCLARVRFYMTTRSINSHYITLHKQTDDGRVVYIICLPTTWCGEIF